LATSHNFNDLSHDAVANHRPFGLNAALTMGPVCPWSVMTSWPLAGSMMTTPPNPPSKGCCIPPAQARRLPSALKATLWTWYGNLPDGGFNPGSPTPHFRVLIVCPLATSHNFTVKSLKAGDAVARCLPFGLKATPVISPVCPLNARSASPLATSHNVTSPGS